MATIKTTDNKNFDIYMDADMFIVPNRAGQVRPDCFDDYFVKKALSVIEANNYEFDITKDKLVQVWLVSKDEESKCDNLNDHSVKFGYDNKLIFVSHLCDELPLNVLKKLKEGDTIDITYPVRGTHDISVKDISHASVEKNYRDWEDVTEDLNINVNLHLHVTCNQEAYRYRRFGKFEDVAAYVD